MRAETDASTSDSPNQTNLLWRFDMAYSEANHINEIWKPIPGFEEFYSVSLAFIGERPEGFDIDHIDGVRGNNQPSNLRYCTRQENSDNTVRRNGQACGLKNGNGKLTAAQIQIARDMKKNGGHHWGATLLAKRFGVSKSAFNKAFTRLGY